MIKRSIFPGIILLCLSIFVQAQKPQSWNAAELWMQLKKLNTLGSALYIAAHPDDENTRLITYLSREKLYQTAYLSLTRGDGGQNLIGPEIGETLGAIRTYELLGARQIDGGKQFFSRAVDFGYSKTSTETFNIWDSVQVLSDMVWVIRNFKPDVMINRFNTVPGETHGHHTASAILSEVAFKLAADPKAFPEQLQYTSVWQPKKLYWNTSRWFYGNRPGFDTTKMVIEDVGSYNPVLGKSYTEIAAEARSMHRSQGFGSATSRGEAMEYLLPLQGSRPGDNIFEGIDVSWKRLKGGEKIGKMVQLAIEEFDLKNPSAIVPSLISIRKEINNLQDSHWKKVKLDEVDLLIKECMGLFIEATTFPYTVTHKDALPINIEVVNRSSAPIQLTSIKYKSVNKDTVINRQLKYNQGLQFNTQIIIPADMPFSQPYWLKNEHNVGMFNVEDQRLIGLPESPPVLSVEFVFKLSGQEIRYETPLVSKRIDPAIGEVYRPLQVIPAAFTKIDKPVYVFSNDHQDTVRVTVTAGKNNLTGKVSLKIPEGWEVSPKEVPISLSQKGQEMIVLFTMKPPKEPSEGSFEAVLISDGKIYSYSKIDLQYDHIPEMSWFPKAKSRVVKIDLKKKGQLIGYIAGAGDAVSESLEWIGYDVRYLNDSDFNNNHLQQYDAIILGIRAYNVNQRLKFYQDYLMEYVKRGGVVIVQYNVNRGLVVDNIAPFKLDLSRDRVTDETAEIKILAPDHPVMNIPNKIVQHDFENWVQERGLYFADSWDDQFVPVFSSFDPGEEDHPKAGGLLIARHGEGYFVYTGYSWFRQLPAGVSGAFRIFTNMISLGK